CVLVVGARPAVQQHLGNLLQQLHYAPVAVSLADEDFAALAPSRFHFTLVAIHSDSPDGIDLLQYLQHHGVDSGPIILLLDKLDAQRVAEAAALGAAAILHEPFGFKDLENTIKTACSRSEPGWRLASKNTSARLDLETTLWRSPPMREVTKVIEQAAQVDISVLVSGETGTGKELVARAIHRQSARYQRPFVRANCAAMPLELLESKLFGHERGAFTGAHQLKIGKFELADHGTIFLDEIGDLHSSLQAKLLHVLQDGEFSRVGGKRTVKSDVRVIAATNQNLERAVAAGRFRDDLYYRLNVIQIIVPPLRERREEIPLLAEYFVQRYSRLYKRPGFSIPPGVMRRLAGHSYPGNVRELENIVKRMIVLNIVKRMIVLGDTLLSWTGLPQAASDDAGTGDARVPAVSVSSLKDISRRAALAAEREAISRVLEQTHWNRVKAAKLLRISYRSLLYKIKQVGINQDEIGLEPDRFMLRSGL
ncbi:MAG: sigma 54-interacting transcriptional regulator, partial [Thermoanaerobaculia bacterium]